MSVYRVVLLLALVGVCLALPNVDWELFKNRHGKHYESLQEDSARRQIFEANRLRIERFNELRSHKLGYTMGLNHLSDWTGEELASLSGPLLAEGEDYPQNSPEAEQFIRRLLADTDDVPASLDWRQLGRVSSVKDQGRCAADFAFATVGLLEGQEESAMGTNRTLIPLSAQYLIDCSDQNSGCSDGLPILALSDIQLQGGINTEADYPYKGVSALCSFKPDSFVMPTKGYATLPTLDEDALKVTVARYGPVAASVNTTAAFKSYRGGVFLDSDCSSGRQAMDLNVLIVGYGTDDTAGDFWILKNSWGEFWGEKGYMRIARGKNQCGIANMPIIARF